MRTFDVIVAGGGPAGAVAALVLSRAGVRVAIFDRARFPRHKLCGDTVNPGALACLRRLGIGEAAGSFAVRGMVVTGDAGVRVLGRYPRQVTGRAVLRRDFDDALLRFAARAGAHVEEEVAVRGLTMTGERVDGVHIVSRGGARGRVAANVVIAADGRQSSLARSLKLARYATAPRRWAVGAYLSGVRGMTDCGEMHIRGDKYFGVAPLPEGLTNFCVVTADRHALARPLDLLQSTMHVERVLCERFAPAQFESAPVTLGPLAVDGARAGVPGLLLAGDAAGFIDPMTGDGLRFAIRGAELAALEALRALERGTSDAHARLAAARAKEFGGKWRFNRALRRLAASPGGIRVAAAFAARLPSCVERAVLYAGDVAVGATPVGALPFGDARRV